MPLVVPSLINFSALIPWPWPKDIDWYLLPIPIYYAHLRKSATGSEPGESTNIKEVVMEESL